MFGSEEKLRKEIDELKFELEHKQAQLDQLLEANTITQKTLADKELRYQHILSRLSALREELNQYKRDGIDYQKRLKNAVAMAKRLHTKNEKLKTQIMDIDDENTQLRALILEGRTQD